MTIPGMQHQKTEYGFSPQLHQQFQPIAQGLDQYQLDCEHIHEATQKIPQGQPAGTCKIINIKNKSALDALCLTDIQQ